MMTTTDTVLSPLPYGGLEEASTPPSTNSPQMAEEESVMISPQMAADHNHNLTSATSTSTTSATSASTDAAAAAATTQLAHHHEHEHEHEVQLQVIPVLGHNIDDVAWGRLEADKLDFGSSLYSKYHDDNDDFFKIMPPGYRFCPEDDELIVHYLRRKVFEKPLPPNRIIDVNIYLSNPDDLFEKYKYNKCGEKELYFFTSRNRKYKNGSRPKRAAGDGYWKATGADRKVFHQGKLVGFRKTLVFYRGRAQHGDKTNWIMHEYRVHNAPARSRIDPADMTLDNFILCRIYKKTDGARARLRQEINPTVVAAAGIEKENGSENIDQDDDVAESKAVISSYDHDHNYHHNNNNNNNTSLQYAPMFKMSGSDGFPELPPFPDHVYPSLLPMSTADMVTFDGSLHQAGLDLFNYGEAAAGLSSSTYSTGAATATSGADHRTQQPAASWRPPQLPSIMDPPAAAGRFYNQDTNWRSMDFQNYGYMPSHPQLHNNYYRPPHPHPHPPAANFGEPQQAKIEKFDP